MRKAKLNMVFANNADGATGLNVEVPKRERMGGLEIYILSIAVFLALLFGYTAINKLITTSVFIFQMRLVPMQLLNWAAPYLAWAVPILELVIIGLIIPDKTRCMGLVASFFLMLIFQAYIIWMRSTGLDLPCTCGGIISSMSWVTHLIFNWIVILLISSAIYFSKREWWNSKIVTFAKPIKRLWKRISGKVQKGHIG